MESTFKATVGASMKSIRLALIAALVVLVPGIAQAAMTATLLDSIHSSTDATTYSFLSKTYTISRLYLIGTMTSVTSGTAPQVNSVTGATLAFTEVGTAGGQCFSTCTRRLQLYRAMPTSTVTETVTISFSSGTSTAMNASIIEFTGMDTSGTNGAGAVVQSVQTDGGVATSVTVTLAAFGNSANRPYMFNGHRGTAEVTNPKSSPVYVELNDGTTSAPAGSNETEWYDAGTDTTPSASWASSFACAGIAAEIKDATPAGGTTGPGWWGNVW
jgi:hypothetical protein